MLGKPLPPFCIPGWLDNIKIPKNMQKLIQIPIRFKSYEHNMLDICSANQYLSKMGWFVRQWLGNVGMHM